MPILFFGVLLGINHLIQNICLVNIIQTLIFVSSIIIHLLSMLTMQYQANLSYFNYNQSQQKLTNKSMEQIANNTMASQFFSTISAESSFSRQVLAIKSNRLDILSSISSDLTGKDQSEKNLLFYACYHKNANALLYLLRRHVPYNRIYDKDGKSLYHICAYSGSVDCIRLLRKYYKLEKVLKFNKIYLDLIKRKNYNRTDFKSGKLKNQASKQREIAFKQLQQDLTQLYIDYVTEINEDLRQALLKKDQNNQRNCFHLGCLNKYQKCSQVLQFLLQEFDYSNLGLSQNKQFSNCCFLLDNQIKTLEPLDIRLYQDVLDNIREVILPQKLAEIQKQRVKKTHQIIKQILNSKDKEQRTPLFIASKDGSTTIINLLQKYEHILCANQNQHEIDQETDSIIHAASNNLARSHILDLCQASKLSNTQTINFLLSCGEQINKKKSIFGTFALLQAVKSFQKQRNMEPIRALIKSGADLNEQDTNGWTILHHSCEKGMKQIVQILLKQQKYSKYVDYNKRTNKSLHALHIAAMHNYPEIIHLLLTVGITQEDQYLQKDQIAKKRKIDVNIKDETGCAPLHYAAKRGSLQALNKLIQQGANIYALDQFKMTPLHYAAANNQCDCIKSLVYQDSDCDQLVKTTNSKGKIAKQLATTQLAKNAFESIFTAARNGNINLIRKIINQDPKQKDRTTPKKERTPLSIAILAQQKLIVKYLTQNQADQYSEDKDGKNAEQLAKQMLEKAKKDKNKIAFENIRNIVSMLG